MLSLKVGDKVYCKCVTNGHYWIRTDFVIGNCYIITKIDFDKVYINGQMFYIWINKNRVADSDGDVWQYSNWFYNNQEVRKLKLKKLKEYESR